MKTTLVMVTFQAKTVVLKVFFSIRIRTDLCTVMNKCVQDLCLK